MNPAVDEKQLRVVRMFAARFGSGGLVGLRQCFARCEQEALFDSWVGLGPNAPTTAAVIRAALGERLDLVARACGEPAEVLAASLARWLPQVVDELTPEGVMPEVKPGLIERWRALLRGAR